ncbi:MAG1430 family protein [Mycoplasmopsis gallinacea]|uniref:Uncharacterized protein n=1 Tax=Mycoplasmopsis gallinacea TaxID=29556 RepID=A0A6H0V2C0_9BACT|nr:hypothetical protein [Mycoplasmopsis gallinacea]QIW61874.1 hypothetical protein GOQ20_00075 [Mycoplasmopsis gallinacea]
MSKKRMSKGLKSALAIGGFLASAGFLAGTITMVHYSKATKELTLSDFTLLQSDAFKKRIKNELASDYATYQNTFSKAKSASYFEDNFIFSSLKNQNQLAAQDLALIGPKGQLLNVFNNGKVNFYFDSYANNIEGKLFIVVTIAPKTKTEENKQVATFEVSGFKKVALSDIEDNIFISSVTEKVTALETYENFEAFKNAYESLETEKQKEEFFNKHFDFVTSKFASVNLAKSNLVFVSENNVAFNLVLNARVDAAQDNKLINVEVDKNMSTIATYEYAIQFFVVKDLFAKFNGSVATKENGDKITIDDFKASYVKNSKKFSKLNLENLPENYDASFEAEVTEDENNYILSYSVYKNPDAKTVLYISKLKLAKDLFASKVASDSNAAADNANAENSNSSEASSTAN